jgi:hypothetical protein
MAEFKEKATFEDVVVEVETTDAILCVIDGKKHWIPKSQIDDDSEVWKEGDSGDLVISEWIANKKELI